MTTVFFIRHAQSDNQWQDNKTRPLTEEGLADTKKITAALFDKGIKHIVSSPYKRTMQTVAHLSDTLSIPIEANNDLRERDVGEWMGDNFLEYIEKQWSDFNYHVKNGECLADVQKRNIAALNEILQSYNGQTIAIATHGTALSTIINYYNPTFDFKSFMKIINYMPYIIKIEFDNDNFISMKEILVIEKKYS